MMTTIAHYNVLDRIGEGGIGELFRARDTKVGRTVALKVVAPAITGSPERLQRLLEDAHAAAGLSHPNIATLWDVGEADGQTYLAYEFAAGRSLREESGGAAMNPRRALDLAVQIADGRTSTYFLQTFGRATRDTVCSCEVKMEPTLSQALHLLNGENTNDKLKAGGVLDKYLSEKLDPMQIVERLYIACLSRKPTPEETAAFQPAFATGTDPKLALEDLFWSLLNSREFLFNH